MSRAKKKHPAVGIDLGTTFSVISLLDDLGRPNTLSNSEGDKITPSVVFFEGENIVVGKEAAKALATDADMVAECAKRDLGNRFYHKLIGGRHYPPEAMQAWVLNKLRLDAEQQIGPIQKAVVTVPAYFDEVRRKATQDAGYIAGLEVIDIINEPTAAAVAFGFQQGFMNPDKPDQERKKILVYDLGGGTFDVTVMEIGGRQFNALATDGDVQLGGKDWDQRIVDFVAEEFIRKFGIDPREDANVLGRLSRDCEDAKRTLSARQKANIACDFQGKAMRLELTRQTFQEITQDLLDRTAFTTRQTLQAAGLGWEDIDRVLLVGGSSRMPAVVQKLKELSGKEPDCSVSPDEAIAHGAALHAGILLAYHDGKSPSFHIRNVNSHSLGVVAMDAKTKRPRNAILIPRNTPLPVVARRIFKTQRAGQKSILVQIVEGESLSPDDCSPLGKCSVRDLPPNLPAQTPIEVRFRYEENGRLTVLVGVEGTGNSLRHDLTRENTLTKEQLDSWRKYVSGLDPADEPEPANLSGEALQVQPLAKAIAETEDMSGEAEEKVTDKKAAAERMPDPNSESGIRKRWT
ncbi:Hsp70 family protein [Anatilimnocola sp. NA78]|uniref:Hsp70 family protein n=1 Tax=Anatilimnocola sp. NA78 TaxID=3415683 RepID=UPI003CE4CD1A